MTTPDKIRALLSDADIGQREAVRLLNLHQVHINERQFRHYCTGKNPCPDVVFRALRDLVRDKTRSKETQS